MCSEKKVPAAMGCAEKRGAKANAIFFNKKVHAVIGRGRGSGDGVFAVGIDIVVGFFCYRFLYVFLLFLDTLVQRYIGILILVLVY